MIEISHISKSFNGKKVLDDISLTIGQKETIFIIGSTGSGKSTLLRCMAGLEFPEEGKILIDSKPLTKANRSRYNHIGMVFQNFNLFPHLTVMKNIILAPTKLGKMTKAEAEA